MPEIVMVSLPLYEAPSESEPDPRAAPAQGVAAAMGRAIGSRLVEEYGAAFERTVAFVPNFWGKTTAIHAGFSEIRDCTFLDVGQAQGLEGLPAVPVEDVSIPFGLIRSAVDFREYTRKKLDEAKRVEELGVLPRVYFANRLLVAALLADPMGSPAGRVIPAEEVPRPGSIATITI